MDIAELGFSVDTRGIREGIRELDNFDRAGRTAGDSGERNGSRIDRSMRNASGGIGIATGAAGGLASKMGGLGAIIAGGFGLSAIGTSAIGMARAFDTSMNDVQAKLDVTIDEMGGLRDMAKEMGAATAFSASEAADGMGYLAQAGLDTGEIMKAMPTALNLAAAASISLAESADIATNVMGGMGMSVEDLPRIADVLAAVSSKANTSVTEMAEALKMAAPVSSEFGGTLEETTAALGIMANAGIKGSQAGIALNSAFTRLVNPVGDGAKVMRELGLQSSDFFTKAADGSIKTKGLANMIDVVTASGADGKAMMRLFGQEAGPKLLALVSAGSEALNELDEAIQSNGQSARMAATQMQGLPGAIKSMSSAWEGLNLAFMEGGASGAVEALVRAITVGLRGATGTIEDAADVLVELNGRLNALNALSDMGVRLDGVYGILQDVLGAVRPLIPYLGDFAIAAAAIGATAGGIALVSAALAAVAGVVLSPVVLGVAAVAAGAVLLRNNWESIAGWWSGMWDAIRGDAEGFADWWTSTTFEEKALSVGTELIEQARSLAEALFSWWDGSTLKEHTPTIVTDAIDSAREIAGDLFDAWKAGTLDEKVAEIEASAIESAYVAAEKLFGWWDASTFDEKVAAVDSSALEAAQGVATTFFDWWDGSTLKAHAPEIATDGVDRAREIAGDFFAWWKDTPIEEREASITTAAIDAATRVAAGFTTWWAGVTLDEKEPVVETSSIERAQSAAESFFAWWDGSRLKEIAPEIALTSMEVARTKVGEFFTWWEGTTLKQKAADITFEMITKAHEAGKEIKAWWDNLTFDPIPLDIEIPTWDSVKDTTSNWLDKASEFGGKIVGGIGDGMERADDHIKAAEQIADETVQAAAGNAGDVQAIGEDVPALIARGMESNKAQLETAARNLTGSIKDGTRTAVADAEDTGSFIGEGVFTGLMSWGTSLFGAGEDSVGEVIAGMEAEGEIQSPSRATMRVGAFLGEGMAIGITESTSTIVSAARFATDQVLQSFGEAGDLLGGFASSATLSFGELTTAVDTGTQVFEDGSAQAADYGTSLEDVIMWTDRSALATRDASGELSDWGREQQSIAQSLRGMAIEQEALTIHMEQGERAADAYRLTTQGYTEEQARAEVAIRESNIAATEKIRLDERIAGNLSDLTTRVQANHIELSEGAMAADRFRLMSEGYTEAQADAQIALEGNAEALEAWRQEIETFERDLKGVIGQSIVDGDGVRATLDSVGDYMSGWARDKIAEFVSNKIVAFFEVDGIEGADAAMEGIKTKVGEVITAFTEADGVFEGFGAAMKEAFGDPDYIGGVTAAIGVMAATIDDTMSKTEVGLRAIGAVIGGIYGGTAGAAIGSEVGGLVNKGLGTDFAVGDQGSQAGYANGGVYGHDFSREQRERSWWRGTEYKDFEFTDLDQDISVAVDRFFSDMLGSVQGQFEAIGGMAADTMFDTFRVAVGTFDGPDAAEELAAFLEQSTRDAYMHGFSSLGPGMQSAIEEQILVAYAPLDDVGVAFDEFAATVGGLMPVMRLLGFEMGDTFDAQGAAAIRLVEAMGGSEAAMARFDYLLQNIVTSADLATLQIKQANASLDGWGGSLRDVDSATAITATSLDGIVAAFQLSARGSDVARVMLDRYTTGIDESTGVVTVNTEAMREHANGLRVGADGVSLVADKIRELADMIDQYGNTLDASRISLELYAASIDITREAGRVAAGQIEAFVTEVDSVTGAVTLNRSALQVYRENIDQTTQSGRDAAMSALMLNNAMGATGVAGIQTRAALLEYINAQDMTTEAGREAAVGAFAQMEAVVALENETIRLREVYLTVGTAVRDLNLTMDMSAPSAVGAADALVQLMGGIDGFRQSMSNYYETFYTETERSNLTLATAAAEVSAFNDRLGLTGQAAIDTGAEFRTYVEGLDLQTESGRAAYRQAMLLVDSMGLVASTTADAENGMSTLDAIIAALPPELRGAFEEMVADAETAAARIDESSGEIEASMFGAGENMRALGLESLAAGTDMEKASAITAESGARTAKAAEDSSEAILLVAQVLVKAFGDTADAASLAGIETQRQADEMAMLGQRMSEASESATGLAEGFTGARTVLDEYVAGLDLSTASGAAAAEQASAVAEAMNAVEAANLMTAEASFAAGQAAIDYATSLDGSTEAGAAAQAEALLFADAVMAAGASGIVAEADLRRYIGSLDLSTEAGQAAYEAAMTYSGALGEAASAQDVLTQLIALLPPELQEAFTEMLAGTDEAGAELKATLPDSVRATYAEMVLDSQMQGDALVESLRESLGNVVTIGGTSGAELAAVIDASFGSMVEQSGLSGGEMARLLSDALTTMEGQTGASGAQMTELLAVALDGMVTDTGVSGAELAQQLGATFDALIADTGLSGDQLVTLLGGSLGEMVAVAGERGAEVAQLMGGAFDAIVNDASIKGPALEREIGAALEQSLRDAGVFSGQMPAEMRPGFDAAVSAAADLARGIRESSGEVVSGANAASGALSSVGGALGGIGSAAGTAADRIAAASRAFTSAASSASQRVQSLDNLRDAGREGAGFDGSHAAGLDYVPFDGYRAQLHRGESVLTADQTVMMNALIGSVSALDGSEWPGRVAANAAYSSPLSPPVISRPAGNGSADLVARMDRLIEQNDQLRRDNAEHARRASGERAAISSAADRTAQATRAVEAETSRTGRKIDAAVSGSVAA